MKEGLTQGRRYQKPMPFQLALGTIQYRCEPYQPARITTSTIARERKREQEREVGRRGRKMAARIELPSEKRRERERERGGYFQSATNFNPS